MLEQHALREMMSEDLLFAKISEPEMAVINFDDHFRDRMGKLDRGHIETETRYRRCSSLGSGGFADTRKVFMLLGDGGDGEAGYGP